MATFVLLLHVSECSADTFLQYSRKTDNNYSVKIGSYSWEVIEYVTVIVTLPEPGVPGTESLRALSTKLYFGPFGETKIEAAFMKVAFVGISMIAFAIFSAVATIMLWKLKRGPTTVDKDSDFK